MSQRDIGSNIRGAVALIPAVITANAGNDGAPVTGPYVDITAVATAPKLPRAVALLISWVAALGAGETLTLTAKFRDATSNGGAGAADYVGDPNTAQNAALAATVVATDSGSGSTMSGVTMIAADLVPCRQFLVAVVTANLSRAGTDTVAIAGTFVFAGWDELPPT